MIYGIRLTGKIETNKKLDLKVIARSKTAVTVEITAGQHLATGPLKVAVGQAQTEIILYDHVNSVKVIPKMTIARLGGGKTPPVTAQFEAVAYMEWINDDSEKESIKIGIMPATWTVVAFNDEAARMKDVDFAGSMTSQGRFMPAEAGPNPGRKYRTNNTGNLSIVAGIEDGKETVTGKAHLIVTVQRWNLPPVR